MNKTHIINIDNTNKYREKQQKKNKLLHLYFDDILVVGRASIQQKLLGNRMAICLFFYSKNLNFFNSARLPAPFFKTKLTRTKQLIDCGLNDKNYQIFVGNVWNIKAYFGKTFSIRYTKVYIIRKTILLAFPCFLFHHHGCSNHSNLEMEAESLTKTLSYLNLSISRTKNARNKL